MQDREPINSEAAKTSCTEEAAESNAIFLGALERWILATLQCNVMKSEDEILAVIVEKLKSAMKVNIEFHIEAAGFEEGHSQAKAKQHQLMARIYASFQP